MVCGISVLFFPFSFLLLALLLNILFVYLCKYVFFSFVIVFVIVLQFTNNFIIVAHHV